MEKKRRDPETIPIGTWEKDNIIVPESKGMSVNKVNGDIVEHHLRLRKRKIKEDNRGNLTFDAQMEMLVKAVAKNGWKHQDIFNRW